MKPILLRPDWALPVGVHAFVSTRTGGFSSGNWQSWNLAAHVGDMPQTVQANRGLLAAEIANQLGHTVDIQWIRQVHGNTLFRAGEPAEAHHAEEVPRDESGPQADAQYTNAAGIALGILTADCLPVLFASIDGKEIAVAHAGWRGMLNGILENTVRSFRADPAALQVWLGPAIGPCHFEVGDEVRSAFMARATAGTRDSTMAAFLESEKANKWFADLYQLARVRLGEQRVGQISGEALCTSCHIDRFYSYRAAPITGRFASLIVKSD